MDNLWGPHTVDRFANSYNSHLPRFNSRFYMPGSESVDAFSISWAGENNWLVPPLHSIIQVIEHIVSSKAQGTLVVPYWPSSGFWPFLFINAYSCQPYITRTIVFPSGVGVFSLGNYKESLIGSDKLTSQVLGVRIVA